MSQKCLFMKMMNVSKKHKSCTHNGYVMVLVDQEWMEWCLSIKKTWLIKKTSAWLTKEALLYHYSHNIDAVGKD